MFIYQYKLNDRTYKVKYIIDSIESSFIITIGNKHCDVCFDIRHDAHVARDIVSTARKALLAGETAVLHNLPDCCTHRMLARAGFKHVQDNRYIAV